MSVALKALVDRLDDVAGLPLTWGLQATKNSTPTFCSYS